MGKFGWDLPPGCTHRMIDEAAGVGLPCAVCCRDTDVCVCTECPRCGETGNPNCYKEHGLMLNKQQVIGRQQAYVNRMQDAVSDAQQFLAYLEERPDDVVYNIDHYPSPYG